MLRRGVIVFWALMLTIVFLTNLCDGLKTIGMLPTQWRFASGNYQLMRSVTARYETPELITAVMFAGVILWEGLASALFYRAVYHVLATSNQGRQCVHAAFATGLALWAAFILADEIFITYDLEAAHLRLFTAQLASLLFWELLSDD